MPWLKSTAVAKINPAGHHGKPYLNRVVYFTRKRGEAIVDGRIILIATTQDEKRAREIFDAFVRSLTFP